MVLRGFSARRPCRSRRSRRGTAPRTAPNTRSIAPCRRSGVDLYPLSRTARRTIRGSSPGSARAARRPRGKHRTALPKLVQPSADSHTHAAHTPSDRKDRGHGAQTSPLPSANLTESELRRGAYPLAPVGAASNARCTSVPRAAPWRSALRNRATTTLLAEPGTRAPPTRGSPSNGRPNG